jgi:predicted MFS family arabinose efflux permease
MRHLLHRFTSRWQATDLLSIPDFRNLWISNTIWWQARWMEELIVGWVVLELTDSASMVALISFARMAPFMVFGPFFGTIVQYASYRWMIVHAQYINLVINGIFSILALTGLLEFWHIALGSVCVGMGSAVDWSSRRAIIPDLVGKHRTTDAMVLETVPQNISRVFGPLMSGVLLEFLGTAGGFLFLFGSYIIQIIYLLRLSPATDKKEAKNTEDSPLKNLMVGLRYVWKIDRIWGVLVITFFMNAFAFSYTVLMPVFARDILNQGPLGLGILAAGVGIGSLPGVALINALKRYGQDGWVYAGSSLLNAVAIMIFALSTSYPLSLAMLILAGVGQAGFSVMQSSIILQSASDAMRARVMGTLVLAIGGGPPGRLAIGAVATAFGAPFALCGSAGIAAVGIIGGLLRLGGLRGKGRAREERKEGRKAG